MGSSVDDLVGSVAVLAQRHGRHCPDGDLDRRLRREQSARVLVRSHLGSCAKLVDNLDEYVFGIFPALGTSLVVPGLPPAGRSPPPKVPPLLVSQSGPLSRSMPGLCQLSYPTTLVAGRWRLALALAVVVVGKPYLAPRLRLWSPRGTDGKGCCAVGFSVLRLAKVEVGMFSCTPVESSKRQAQSCIYARFPLSHPHISSVTYVGWYIISLASYLLHSFFFASFCPSISDPPDPVPKSRPGLPAPQFRPRPQSLLPPHLPLLWVNLAQARC